MGSPVHPASCRKTFCPGIETHERLSHPESPGADLSSKAVTPPRPALLHIPARALGTINLTGVYVGEEKNRMVELGGSFHAVVGDI